MSAFIIPERLALLPTIHLHRGSHKSFKDGHCINEVAAWLAGEEHSDSPRCVSPVLSGYTERLNDGWPDEQRQKLLPYAELIIGTAGDGKDRERVKIAQRALASDLLPAWLRLAGMDVEAESLEQMAHAEIGELRRELWRTRDAAWARRSEWRAQIKKAIRDRLKGTADADAVAAAVAAAAAAAAADAAADAVDAVIAAVDAAAVDLWCDGYTAYRAARKFWDDYFATHQAEKVQAIRDLAAAQRAQALTLLDRMIDPKVTS